MEASVLAETAQMTPLTPPPTVQFLIGNKLFSEAILKSVVMAHPYLGQY